MITSINRSRERVKAFGEVFTPPELVNEMLDKLPKELWLDPTKTWIDNSAGDGNFMIAVRDRLLAHHPLKHILENQIFAVDIMPDNIEVLQHRLGYLIDDKPNPLLDPSHFSEDVLDEECRTFSPDHLTTYLHHRNIVCANALTYDYDFGRSKQLLTW